MISPGIELVAIRWPRKEKLMAGDKQLKKSRGSKKVRPATKKHSAGKR